MTAAAVPVPSGGILVASANSHIRDHVLSKLQLGRGPICIASGGAEALEKLDSGNWQTLILDRQLPDLDAEELRGITEREYPGVRVMLLDPSSGAPQNAELSYTATRHGRTAACGSEPIPGMVGESRLMREMYRMVRLVARRNTTVLVTGPTGSGKELVARAIHRLSGRASAGFAVLNCAAIPETLIESELFGYLPSTADDSPLVQCLRSEMRDILARAIGELPEKERQVLALYYFEELTMKEVGMVLGVGESRVSQIHSMAVVRLRARMAELTAAHSKGARKAAAR
jgi:RNA polymerase sigma factor (sigma-70 family)